MNPESEARVFCSVKVAGVAAPRWRVGGAALALLLGAGVVWAAGSGKPGVKEATAEEVRNCRPLGEVLGEHVFCTKEKPMERARQQAVAKGATHLVWLSIHCVAFSGEKASALIYDCSEDRSLDEVFENLLAVDPRLEGRTIEAQGAPRVMRSSDLDEDSADLAKRGYVLTGYAGVAGGRVPLAAIRDKATEVKAELALVQAAYAGEDVEYQSVTTYRGGGAAVGFSGGYGFGSVGATPFNATGLRTSVSSVPGERRTDWVPFSERRFDTQVLFWRKLRPGPLGLFLDLVPPEIRQQLGRNTGAFVVGVEDESPAFFANIVSGDVIIGVEGREIRTPAELGLAVESTEAASMSISILRNGQSLTIQLGP